MSFLYRFSILENVAPVVLSSLDHALKRTILKDGSHFLQLKCE